MAGPLENGAVLKRRAAVVARYVRDVDPIVDGDLLGEPCRRRSWRRRQVKVTSLPDTAGWSGVAAAAKLPGSCQCGER